MPTENNVHLTNRCNFSIICLIKIKEKEDTIVFSNVKRIIFDVDFTLIDHDDKIEGLAVAKILKIKDVDNFLLEMNNLFEKSEKNTKNKIITRSSYENLINRIIPTLEIEGLKASDFLEAIIKRESVLMSGAKETLEYLYNKGYIIQALTNWFGFDQMKIMKKLDILDYFERVYGWDNNYPKPSKRNFLRCLDNKEPKEILYVGDNPITDIEPAKKIGMYTIGININKEKYNHEKYVPNIYIESLLEITSLL